MDIRTGGVVLVHEPKTKVRPVTTARPALRRLFAPLPSDPCLAPASRRATFTYFKVDVLFVACRPRSPTLRPL